MNCARSVIELITRYWPYSIDILKPERAIVDGFRPIFFAGQGNVRFLSRLGYWGLNSANRPTLRSHSLEIVKGKPSISGRTNVQPLFYDIFLCTDTFHSGILVRNDAARDRLQQKLKNSIIMSDPTFLAQLFT